MDEPAKQRSLRVERSRDEVQATCVQILRLSLWLCLMVSHTACEKPSTRLLEMREVRRDDSAHSLSISGSGFPATHVGEAELSGTLYRPGAAARTVRTRVRCHALSEELLRVELTPKDGESFESGLFEGRVEAHFPSREGSSEVVGSIAGVRIRFEGTEDGNLPSDLSLQRRARRFQQGVGARDVEATARGLTLLSVAPDSLLERAGVQAGDRIERIDGAPVERVFDLLPQDERSAHTLQLLRKRDGKRVAVVLAAASPDGSRAGAFAGLAFLVAVLSASLLPIQTAITKNRKAGRARILGFTLCALCFALFGHAQNTLDIRLFYGMPVLCCLALLALSFTRDRTPLFVVLHQISWLSASTLALAGLTILSGSLTVPWAGASELALPTHWTLLNAPPAWLALWVMHAARPSTPSPLDGSVAAEWLDITHAVCVVALALGAGTLPHSALNLSHSPALALSLFAFKVMLVHLLLRQPTALRSRTVLAVAALLCPLSAWCFASLALPSQWLAALGALALGFWLTRSVLQHTQAQRRSARDPALAPFL